MRTTRWLIAPALALSVGLTAFVGPSESSASARGNSLEQEITNLIKDLGDNSYRVRERATKRLAEIGVLALADLYDAEQSAGDLETQRRATLLIGRIRTANRLPTRVDGLEFELIASKEWRIPEPGLQTEIEIGLKITNTSKTVSRLNLVFTMKVILKDAAGMEIPMQGGRWPSIAPGMMVSPPLAINQSFTMLFKGNLIHSMDRLAFSYRDQFAILWQWPGLSRGTYQLSFLYENRNQSSPQGEPLWIGRAETWSESVVIK